MDELRQALFGISLASAAGLCHLEQERPERVKEALDLVARASRQALEVLEELESEKELR